jgi:hypothetical protein
MNYVFFGTTDVLLLHGAPQPFLYIGDKVSPTRARVFDPARHHFNPLIGITPEKAVGIADIIYAADPGGESTLTVRNRKQALAEMLLTAAPFDELTGDKKDPAQAEALRSVRAMLFFPTLRKILCTGRQFDFSGSVVARIDRAALGDKQALMLGLLLIGQHKGHIILDDAGFYLRPLHTTLIQQERLLAHVRYMSELGRPEDLLRQAVLSIPNKTGQGCTYDDAVVLSKYQGWAPHNNILYVLERMAPYEGLFSGGPLKPSPNDETDPLSGFDSSRNPEIGF